MFNLKSKKYSIYLVLVIVISNLPWKVAFSCENTEIEEMKKVGVSEDIIKYYCELYYSKKPKYKLQKFEIEQEINEKVNEKVNDDMMFTKNKNEFEKINCSDEEILELKKLKLPKEYIEKICEFGLVENEEEVENVKSNNETRNRTRNNSSNYVIGAGLGGLYSGKIGIIGMVKIKESFLGMSFGNYFHPENDSSEHVKFFGINIIGGYDFGNYYFLSQVGSQGTFAKEECNYYTDPSKNYCDKKYGLTNGINLSGGYSTENNLRGLNIGAGMILWNDYTSDTGKNLVGKALLSVGYHF